MNSKMIGSSSFVLISSVCLNTKRISSRPEVTGRQTVWTVRFAMRARTVLNCSASGREVGFKLKGKQRTDGSVNGQSAFKVFRVALTGRSTLNAPNDSMA
jgi:hypothetical protein